MCVTLIDDSDDVDVFSPIDNFGILLQYNLRLFDFDWKKKQFKSKYYCVTPNIGGS